MHHLAGLDIGYPAGQAFVDFDADFCLEYCRVVGAKNHESSFVSCSFFSGVQAGQTNMSYVLDWGYPAGRAWVDLDGDWKYDFCRVVGNVNGQSSRVSCAFSTGVNLEPVQVVSEVIDWGYPESRRWADVNN